MAKPKQGKQVVEVPLLKAYLRSVPSYPEHVPGWINAAGWGIFIALLLLLNPVPMGGMSLIIAPLAGYLSVIAMRARYKARTDAERADEALFAAIRRLKALDHNHGYQKGLPPQVLYALENAVATYNAALAKLTVEDPVHAGDGKIVLQRSLHACFLAANTVARDDEHSRKEWQALVDNKLLTAEIVETIHQQTARMRSPFSSIDADRLAALRELDMDLDTLPIRE